MRRASTLSLTRTGTGGWVALCLAIAWIATPVEAKPGPSASAATSAAPSIPLPPLPQLSPLERGPPTPKAVQALEGHMAQLLDTEVSGPVDPQLDLRFLTSELAPTIVPAISQRLQELRISLKGGSAERMLRKAREAGSHALKKAQRAQSKRGEDKELEGDWLNFILALHQPQEATWRNAVELYGMLRMLEHLGTTPAVREMIACYSYFGDLVRIDLQRAMARLQDKAVPALIEARKHDARKVQRWAGRQLDQLGRAIPGEAVSTADPRVLADVLEAFGRTRNVDAVRVILSFCNSDRVGLREAARAAIAAIGEPSKWQLQEVYLSHTGAKAPRSWSWERTARELFRLFDQARLTEVYELMEKGAAAHEEGRHQEAVSAFDGVLARAPLFERRADMAPAFVAHADGLAQEGKNAEALETLRKALRLAPGSPDHAKIEARITVLEGQALIEAGTPDRFLLRRALELDPDNEKARELLASLDQASVQRQVRSRRHAIAVGVGVAALLLMVLLARRPKRRLPKPSAAQPQDAPPAPAQPDDKPDTAERAQPSDGPEETPTAELSDHGDAQPSTDETPTQVPAEARAMEALPHAEDAEGLAPLGPPETPQEPTPAQLEEPLRQDTDEPPSTETPTEPWRSDE